MDQGNTAGFYSVVNSQGDVYLDHMFLRPSFMRKGVGTALIIDMISNMRENGIKVVKVYVDPNAEGFYIKMGAKLEKWVESSIKGRQLPIYRFDIE